MREGLREVKGFWGLSQFFYTMGRPYEIMTAGGWITHGDAAKYGWAVYFAIAANRYGGRIW